MKHGPRLAEPKRSTKLIPKHDQTSKEDERINIHVNKLIKTNSNLLVATAQTKND